MVSLHSERPARLGSCLRHIAKLLDADPWDALLLRAYREIGAGLREGRTAGFAPDVAALIERRPSDPAGESSRQIV
jgi:hypothetical protein